MRLRSRECTRRVKIKLICAPCITTTSYRCLFVSTLVPFFFSLCPFLSRYYCRRWFLFTHQTLYRTSITYRSPMRYQLRLHARLFFPPPCTTTQIRPVEDTHKKNLPDNNCRYKVSFSLYTNVIQYHRYTFLLILCFIRLYESTFICIPAPFSPRICRRVIRYNTFVPNKGVFHRIPNQTFVNIFHRGDRYAPRTRRYAHTRLYLCLLVGTSK